MTTSTSADARKVVPSLLACALGLACAHTPTPRLKADLQVAQGTSVATLGRVVVMGFDVHGAVRVPGDDAVVRRAHPDTMGVTDSFVGPWVAADIVLVDRELVDAQLASGGARGDDATALKVGRALGAQTLVVGRYEFECTGKLLDAAGGDFVEPEQVHRQTLRVRGLELSSGQQIFDVTLEITDPDVGARLLPRSLGKTAAKRLLKALRSSEGGS